MSKADAENIEKGSDIVTRLLRLDVRYIYAIVIISVAMAVLMPIGSPIGVTWPTKRVFDAIEGLRPGSKVLVGQEMLANEWAEYGTYGRAITEHLMMKDLKLFFVSFWQVDAPTLMNQLILKDMDGGKRYGRKYGVDYVELGVLPGQEPTMAAFGADIKKVATKDFYGTSLGDIPIMKEVNKAQDFDFVVVMAGSAVALYIRQFAQRFKLPMVAGTHAGYFPTFLPYMASGHLIGIVNGIRGAAEYEILIKKPGVGDATRYADAVSLTFSVVFVFLILGNVLYLLERRRR